MSLIKLKILNKELNKDKLFFIKIIMNVQQQVVTTNKNECIKDVRTSQVVSTIATMTA